MHERRWVNWHLNSDRQCHWRRPFDILLQKPFRNPKILAFRQYGFKYIWCQCKSIRRYLCPKSPAATRGNLGHTWTEHNRTVRMKCCHTHSFAVRYDTDDSMGQQISCMPLVERKKQAVRCFSLFADGSHHFRYSALKVRKQRNVSLQTLRAWTEVFLARDSGSMRPNIFSLTEALLEAVSIWREAWCSSFLADRFRRLYLPPKMSPKTPKWHRLVADNKESLFGRP